MATNESINYISGARTSGGKRTRRTWSVKEEEVLLQSLKDAVVAGWKSENGFRTGYLIYLESKMKEAFPGTDLRGNPHIDSKIHVWKRTYGQLRSILSRSGVGWNETDNTIDASEDAWVDIVKMDSAARGFRHKPWPLFNDWTEIFGQDRATREFVETFTECGNAPYSPPMSEWAHAMDLGNRYSGKEAECAGESASVSQPHSVTVEKSKKRKTRQEEELSIAAAINNFALSTRETMVAMMKEFAHTTRATPDVAPVLAALAEVTELSIADRVEVAEIFADHPSKAELFFNLTPDERNCFVRRLLTTARFRF